MANTVDAYIAGFPPNVQTVLEKIREIIKKAAPDAHETISYGIPTLKLNGSYLMYFAGFKKHVSVYPILSECPGFEDELTPYRSGRGTAKFQLNRPIPYTLIAKIMKFMVQENAHRTANKPSSMQKK
jgi:uncharacterized protein YdhG (YjbR/CyaY superfamily)